MPTLLVKKTDWILREALLEDKDNLKTFFKKNLWEAKENSDGIFAWKYERNPLGKALALIGENSQKEIVATSMFMPAKLFFNNTILKACQWVDLFVEPEYRGQPLPSQSLQQGLEEFRKSGAPICFAFPNDNSVPLHKKNNGIHLGLILRYTKPLDVEYLVTRKIKNRFFSKAMSVFVNFFLKLISKETYLLNFQGFSVEKIEHCGSEFDDLWNKCINSNTCYSKHDPDISKTNCHPDPEPKAKGKDLNEESLLRSKIMTCRDSAYLNWKYVNSPNPNRKLFALKKDKKMEGFVVFESTARIGYIVDILAVSQSALNHLIAFSLKYFRKQNKDSAVFVALENNMYFSSFKGFDFVERPEAKHFYIYLEEHMVNKEYFQDSRNWFITIGDCDIESL